MYTILIVEDEKYARDYVGKYLSDNLGEYFHILSAVSAEQALEVLKRNKINIVVTDIRMTGMSGLELAKIIDEEYSDIVVMITSGYEEFEYAKSAIKYNVREYFVKPFELDELKSAILRVKTSLDKQRKNAFEDTRTIAEEREMFFVDLVYGGKNDIDAIVAESQKLCFPFDIVNTPCDIISLKVNSYDDFINDKWSYTKESFKIAVSNIISGFLESDYVFYIHSSDGRFEYVVYHTDNIIPNYEEVSQKINDILKIPVSLYKIGETYKNLQQLLEKSGASRAEDEKVLLLVTHIKENNDEEAKKVLESIMEAPEGLAKITDMLISSKLITDKNFVFDSDMSFEEIYHRLIQIVKPDENSYNEPMERAKKYINENFHKNISREEVAKFVYFSPAYFTRSFKQYTGENFNDYILKLRMNKAIELMKQNKYKIFEIAEKIGYENSKYFFRVFKMYTGYTPKDYISKIIGKEEPK